MENRPESGLARYLRARSLMKRNLQSRTDDAHAHGKRIHGGSRQGDRLVIPPQSHAQLDGALWTCGHQGHEQPDMGFRRMPRRRRRGTPVPGWPR